MSTGCKKVMQYGVRSVVSEEELNARIRKVIPGKTKIARKYGLKNFEGKKKMNLKYQFDSFI